MPELWQEREPVPSPSVRLLVRAPVQRALVQGFLSWACQMWRHSQVPVRALLPWWNQRPATRCLQEREPVPSRLQSF